MGKFLQRKKKEGEKLKREVLYVSKRSEGSNSPDLDR